MNKNTILALNRKCSNGLLDKSLFSLVGPHMEAYGRLVKLKIWCKKLIEITDKYMEPLNPRYHRIGIYTASSTRWNVILYAKKLVQSDTYK